MLTPVDIETIDFKKVALGYSQDEVDEFLDRVIVEFEMLYKENLKLNDKVTVLEEGLKYYKDLEDTLRNSIVLAEKTATETKQNASQSSDHIIKEAKLRANEILQDANKRLYDMEFQAMQMKKKYDSFKAKLKGLLIAELEFVNSSDFDIDEEARREEAAEDDEYYNDEI